MVKHVNLAFDDEEFAVMVKKKGDRNWEDVLRDGLEVKKGVNLDN